MELEQPFFLAGETVKGEGGKGMFSGERMPLHIHGAGSSGSPT